MATLPIRSTKHSAGYDLFSTKTVSIKAGARELISTGISWEKTCPNSKEVGFIKPRSSLAYKHGIDVMAGVIDGDYTGEIKVLLINHGFQHFHIKSGDKIAQIVLLDYVITEPDNLVSTERFGGFGSTGK